MSENNDHYALPLFALIDRARVDLSQPIPDDLAEQLALFLAGKFGIESLSSKVVSAEAEPYLVLHAVPVSALPALLSLADVQGTQLFRYEREDEERFLLTPLAVKVD